MPDALNRSRTNANRTNGPRPNNARSLRGILRKKPETWAGNKRCTSPTEQRKNARSCRSYCC